MFEDIPHVDTDVIEELKSIMEEEFEHLIKLYLQDSQERLSVLLSALKTQDIDLATKTLHALKGASSNVGAQRLYQLCQSAEEAGRQQDITHVTACHALINQEFTTVSTVLTQYI